MAETLFSDLTPEQEADLPVFLQHYFDMAQSATPMDREAITKAIGDAYQEIGWDRPDVIVLQSPLQAQILLHLLENHDNLDITHEIQRALHSETRKNCNISCRLFEASNGVNILSDRKISRQLIRFDQLEELERETSKTYLKDQLIGKDLIEDFGKQLYYQMKYNLSHLTDSHYNYEVSAQTQIAFIFRLTKLIRSKLSRHMTPLTVKTNDQLRDDNENIFKNTSIESNYIDNPVSSYNLSNLRNLDWIAHYRFMQNLGVNFDEEAGRRLTIVENIAQLCERWWPYENICFVSEKPQKVCWDSEDRLHNLQGPAVEYADGFSVYAVEGVRVSESWIKDPSSLSPSEALLLRDTEKRTIACNHIVGWDRILDNLDAETIDKDEDPMVGELVEVTLPDHGKQRFLRVLCGTGRRFAIGVSNDHNTALEANAQTYGLPPDIYKQLEFRT